MNNRMLMIAEIAIMSALGIILGFVKLSGPWAFGGSVSLEMVPIFIMAFRRGVAGGVLTGLMIGILQLIINPYIVHPVQVVLDYPLAFLVVGLAGLFRPKSKDSYSRRIWLILLGTFIGSLFRLISHVISGVIFFASAAPEGTPVWLYSITYNSSYIVPTFILTVVLLALLSKTAPKLVHGE
ncbi:energy-coupled thiamine transporter ThiT [Pseudalkalibacillus salsuginis]|uniref:energy-coupled thiamine transporter ThiT n=1 Tax=Pseudalkalibacillus salsuginis TaxID=2910972 RepID=UPI001F2C6A1A|nr:energy-coupled thiamine transporter ThiT [Pseudalkalibacillus salsuginis]MCF6410521.1 energy-coupled thiamine transporter ThiT [Pseudalkalibacillus salsuginis]